jgi:GH24 family phage-related lysozyme (muramidase)
MTDTLLFNYARRKKREWSREPMAALNQGEVDELNAVIREWKASNAPGSAPAAQGSQGLSDAASAAGGALRASQAGLNLIHSFEQCKLTAYPDPGSRDGKPWTVGWGSTGPDIGPGTVWTQAQADERFRQDISGRESKLNAILGGAPTTQAQFDAMLSLGYNIGMDALAGSTVMRRHKAGDHEGAATAFGLWNKNDGQVLRGLVRRRAAEADLYRGLLK